jgi:hypothetical protein
MLTGNTKIPLVITIIIIVLLSACASPQVESDTGDNAIQTQTNTPEPNPTDTAAPLPSDTPEPITESNDRTGIPELDNIIEVTLSGDVNELRSLIEFTQSKCTHAEGLGGPPKCRADEAEGTPVEVLPFLGPEGSFIRRSEIEDWKGVQAGRVYAVYEVPDSVYSDEDYPKGEYAIMFIEDSEHGFSITLQVTQGRIVRIDYGFSYPPEIPEEQGVRYLLGPIK